ncbi:Very-short-patch-repair endonuclease [Rhizobium sp. RU20A]|nr:Very-short-patch-repair endonuclease [Rhizobium sp. RU20A]
MSPNTITKRRPGKTMQARRLRRAGTLDEHDLCNALRNRHLNGYKFARQVPLGPYIVDFLCREHRLVIELDGYQHADSKADLQRTEWLNANGYSVLRFWNHEFGRDRASVLDTILATLTGALTDGADNDRFHPSQTGQ